MKADLVLASDWLLREVETRLTVTDRKDFLSLELLKELLRLSRTS